MLLLNVRSRIDALVRTCGPYKYTYTGTATVLLSVAVCFFLYPPSSLISILARPRKYCVCIRSPFLRTNLLVARRRPRPGAALS